MDIICSSCSTMTTLSTHISKRGNFSLGRDKKLRVRFFFCIILSGNMAVRTGRFNILNLYHQEPILFGFVGATIVLRVPYGRSKGTIVDCCRTWQRVSVSMGVSDY